MRWRDDPAEPVVFRSGTYDHPSRRGRYDLVGVSRGVGSWSAWGFTAGGLTVFVTEATAGPPSPGSPLLVRGCLSVAEPHVVDEFDPGDPMVADAERSFVVERVVRMQAGRSWEVPAVGRARPWGFDYLLTLAER
ncbi:hypothetical protein [Nucisporomicrobium flavum]|uniref:hypothetical protein n=1 Tax=Nucisporomicrobium flavum TaxID=2785915 RepID=UPI0018F4EF62|nr:hypothetical protein [Nucisporomicrobium flavum]